MLFGMTYYQIFCYFIIYSFVGWCIEVVYHAIRYGRVINRGFFNGPVCPVYGFGVIVVFGVINVIAWKLTYGGTAASLPLPILYVVGMILTTMVELMGGVLLDRCFHARWWDYTHEKFNLNGYICLKFSLLWGVGIVLIVRIFHPLLIEGNLARFPQEYGRWVLVVMYAAYAADLIISALTMINLNKRLAEIEEMRQSMRVVSNTLSMALAEGTFAAENLVGRNSADRMFAAATEADVRNTLETRKEFDAKYEAMQADVNEAKDKLLTSANEKRAEFAAGVSGAKDTLLDGVAGAKEAMQMGVTRAKETVFSDANAPSTAKGYTAGKFSEAADMLTERVSEAADTLTEKVSVAAKVALENMADYQLRLDADRELKRAEAAKRRDQLERDREEWIRKFNERRHRLIRHVFRSNPGMHHMKYQEAFEELRGILDGEKE
ncbi:MAG: hypothetical protein Q4A32_10310 [Lachnospiraceae bacterium]|nr:hypothetical protein [Lachnospiraceae bacterium]